MHVEAIVMLRHTEKIVNKIEVVPDEGHKKQNPEQISVRVCSVFYLPRPRAFREFSRPPLAMMPSTKPGKGAA